MAKDARNITDIVSRYRQELQRLNICSEKIILFGSYAEGRQRLDSDIDLIVVSKDFQPFNVRERLEVLGLASGRILEPIEAFGYTPNEIESATSESFLWDVLHTKTSIEISL